MVFSRGMKQRLWVCLIQMSKDRKLQVKWRLKLVFKNCLWWCVKCNRYAISYLYSFNHIHFCHEIMWLFQENHCEFQWEFTNDANMAHLGCFWNTMLTPLGQGVLLLFHTSLSNTPYCPFPPCWLIHHMVCLTQASECVAYNLTCREKRTICSWSTVHRCRSSDWP